MARPASAASSGCRARRERLHQPVELPLAIFTGQVAATLAAGNTVIAKPAEQTPRIGFRALEILYGRAFRPMRRAASGSGDTVGAALVADPQIAGVAFTGSVETAKRINAALAGREGRSCRSSPKPEG